MEKIPTDQFLAFCRELEGFELTTMARKTKFSVFVTEEGLEFLVSGTGNRRKHTLSYVESFNKRFAELNDDDALLAGNYNDLTANASYQLALVNLFIRMKGVFLGLSNCKA
jgi:hypothetical protein